MGVFDERHVQHRVQRVGLRHHRRHVVGDQHTEHPTEELPRRLAPVDDRPKVLVERQPHKRVTRHPSGEHQRPDPPPFAGLFVEHLPELTEIDLQLHPRLTIDDRDRRPGRCPELRSQITVQRPLRDNDTLAAQQLDHLLRWHVVVAPARQLVPMGDQHVPRFAVTIRDFRGQLGEHPTHKIVGQPIRTVGLDQPPTLRDPHDLRHRFPVAPHHLCDPPERQQSQPQPQHLSHFKHRNLPVCH